MRPQNITLVEDRLFIVSETINLPVYDFDFTLQFACRHPHRIDGTRPCVLRIGAIPDYGQAFQNQAGIGLRLVNTPAEHELASELANWYPKLHDLTPRTEVYERLPSADEIESRFSWPIFLKGSRQTSRHDPSLSIIRDRSHYQQAAERYRRDDILHWQRPVVREFVPLEPVAGGAPGSMPPSLEYRSFWWHGACVGWGRYWYQAPDYTCADADVGLALAGMAAARLRVPFLVVDVAKTRDGRWIVIECNDAQEAGYAAVPAYWLWRKVLDLVQA